jgi:hypothetical protein
VPNPMIIIPPEAAIVSCGIVLLLYHMTAMTMLLLFVRFLGTGLVKLTDDPASRGPTNELQPWQFSVRSLLEWALALALVLGATSYLPGGRFPIDFIDPFDPPALPLFVSSMPLMLAAMWTALGTRPSPVRWIVLALATLVSAAGFTALAGLDEFGWVLLFCAGHALWLVGSLWVLRLLGYRLASRRRTVA